MLYERAQVMLEYGNCGSTLPAARQPVKQLFAMKSDTALLFRLNTQLLQLRTDTRMVSRYSSIGVVKALAGGRWKTTGRVGYPGYALGIWGEE